MDVQEYAKEKGIPVGSIPVHAFRKAQQTPVTIRQAENSKAEAFKKLCTDTKELVDKCQAKKGVCARWEKCNCWCHSFIVCCTKTSSNTFSLHCASTQSDACTDLGIKHMECMLQKREEAYQLAVKLAGKEKVDTVLPYYEDSRNKAMELINVYKSNEGGKAKKDVFWG